MSKHLETKGYEKSSPIQTIHRHGRRNKKLIVTAVQSVSLSPLVDQLKSLGQFTALKILQQMFNSYGVIDEIYLKENAVESMGPYNPAEPPARRINQLEKEIEFARAGGKTIANPMMVSKGITLLAQIANFNKNIWELHRKSTKIKHGQDSRHFSSRV